MRVIRKGDAMKIGMEHDRLEEIDRELERAIATAVAAYFDGEPIDEAIEDVGRLSRDRIDLSRPRFEERLVA